MRCHYKKFLDGEHPIKVDHNLLTQYKKDENWNFERKLTYYPIKRGKKREDIFSKEVFLKIKHNTIPEWKLKVQLQRSKLIELRNKLKSSQALRKQQRSKLTNLKNKSKKNNSKQEKN